jgi:hypothetical protein
MKKIILSILLFGYFFAQAQVQPSGLPTRFNNTWYEFTQYLSVNGGLLLPLRDTNFIPSRVGTVVVRPQDSLLYVFKGSRWQFVGKNGNFGIYTNGYGLNLNGNQFKVDTTKLPTYYYVDAIDDSLRLLISTKLNTSDTASLSNRINLKVNTSDLSGILAPYATISSVSAGLATKVSYTDSLFRYVTPTQLIGLGYGRLAFPNTWLQQNQFVQAILTDTIYAGKGGGGNPFNTVFSRGGMSSNTTGAENSSFGAAVLGANTTGGGNTGGGAFALASNTTGDNNTATGNKALLLNEIGSENTANGSSALDTLIEGVGNSAFGRNAGKGIARGSFNTIIGSSTDLNRLPFNLTNNIILQTGQGLIRQRFDNLKWTFYADSFSVKKTLIISKDTVTANASFYTEKLLLPTTGSNKTAGTDTLVNGTITINTSAINANSKVIISRKSALGSTALGQLTYSVSAGIITVESLNPNTPALLVTNDNSSFDWVIIN